MRWFLHLRRFFLMLPTNAFSTDIVASFKDDEAPREVCIAGRMMSRNIMGKASFIKLQDSKGRIQVYIKRDDLEGDFYNTVFKKLLDIGDFIGVKGFEDRKSGSAGMPSP